VTARSGDEQTTPIQASRFLPGICMFRPPTKNLLGVRFREVSEKGEKQGPVLLFYNDLSQGILLL